MKYHIDLEVELPDDLKPGAIAWSCAPEVVSARLLGYSAIQEPGPSTQIIAPNGFDPARVKGL